MNVNKITVQHDVNSAINPDESLVHLLQNAETKSNVALTDFLIKLEEDAHNWGEKAGTNIDQYGDLNIVESDQSIRVSDFCPEYGIDLCITGVTGVMQPDECVRLGLYGKDIGVELKQSDPRQYLNLPESWAITMNEQLKNIQDAFFLGYFVRQFEDLRNENVGRYPTAKKAIQLLSATGLEGHPDLTEVIERAHKNSIVAAAWYDYFNPITQPE